MLVCKELTKKYDDYALYRISLALSNGTVMGLVGEIGSYFIESCF